jgi:uncharacterized protein with HEPN domain
VRFAARYVSGYWQKPNRYEAPRTTEYLDHVIEDMNEQIRRINAYNEGLDRMAFDRDMRTQDAIIRNLEAAARDIQQHSPTPVAAHPEVPSALAYKMRNSLSHGYANIGP